MEPWQLHLVFATGGGLGATLRHFVGQRINHSYPTATLLVNVFGSFLLGALLSLLLGQQQPLAEHWAKLALGFCGGFTTFSSFAYQSLSLGSTHTWQHAIANVVLNVVLCLLAFGLGSYVLA